VRKQLGFIKRGDRFDRLEFHYNAIVGEDINSESGFKPHVFIYDGKPKLPLEWNVRLASSWQRQIS